MTAMRDALHLVVTEETAQEMYQEPSPAPGFEPKVLTPYMLEKLPDPLYEIVLEALEAKDTEAWIMRWDEPHIDIAIRNKRLQPGA